MSAFRSTTNKSIDDLTHDLNSLSVSPLLQVWTVGWDSTVLIVDDGLHNSTITAPKVTRSPLGCVHPDDLPCDVSYLSARN